MRLNERFEQALVFAARLHKEQRRKGSETPYISHLLAVAALVLEHGGDEDEAIAALLHDAIEDQGGEATRWEIRKRFGGRVTDIIDGCSDSEIIPKPPWKQRKTAYIEHLKTAPSSVRLVSAADKVHNARTVLNDYRRLGDDVWDRFRGGKEGTLWYYRTLVTTFQEAGTTPLVEQLDRVVYELEQLVGVQRPRP